MVLLELGLAAAFVPAYACVWKCGATGGVDRDERRVGGGPRSGRGYPFTLTTEASYRDLGNNYAGGEGIRLRPLQRRPTGVYVNDRY